MKTPRRRISSMVASQTLKSGSSPKLSKQIAAFLMSERRVNDLDSILRDIQAEWAEAGQVEVIASSAHDLTAAIKANITREVKKFYPAAKRIIITPVHDPEIIGGVRLSFADRQLDLSVEAKLNKFKQLTTAGKD